MYSKIKEANICLGSITIYRGILQNEVIASLNKLVKYIDSNDIDPVVFAGYYGEFYNVLTKNNSFDSFVYYIFKRMIYDENAFSDYASKEPTRKIDVNILRSVEHDLDCIQKISQLTSKDIKDYVVSALCNDEAEKYLVRRLPEWDFSNIPADESIGEIMELFMSQESWQNSLEALIEFYRARGSGKFAEYKGFVWENSRNGRGLIGVETPDPVRLSDLTGYELERKEVIENTRFFVEGLRANNVLLYGDRGTGKSSTVKALLNEYGDQGLRIIEVPKQNLSDLPEIIRIVKDKPQKFILFIDDLAFEDSEEKYTALKAVLEGGLSVRSRNVVIYATSNRRHLIKEKFSDRAGLMSNNNDDEIRAGDTIQEKLSLADRFGITVTFSLPDKKRYLDIIDNLAMSRGLNIDKEWLHKEAMKWELLYNGRSPRTAQQFIDWVEGLSSLGLLT